MPIPSPADQIDREVYDRLLDTSLDCVPDPRDRSHRRYFVRSGTNYRQVYAVTPDTCGCQAYRAHRYCRHRIRVIHTLGLEEIYVREKDNGQPNGSPAA